MHMPVCVVRSTAIVQPASALGSLLPPPRPALPCITSSPPRPSGPPVMAGPCCCSTPRCSASRRATTPGWSRSSSRRRRMEVEVVSWPANRRFTAMSCGRAGVRACGRAHRDGTAGRGSMRDGSLLRRMRRRMWRSERSANGRACRLLTHACMHQAKHYALGHLPCPASWLCPAPPIPIPAALCG